MLTTEQKEAAKEKLRQTIKEEKLNTFDNWIHLFEAEPEVLKHFGYSRGAEDMIKKLAAYWRKKEMALMKPFDDGEFD